MKQILGLRTGQTLAMTPALQQSIRMLQLSALDLQAEVQAALESNLMLEAVEESPASDVAEALAEPAAPEADDEAHPEIDAEPALADVDMEDLDWAPAGDLPSQRDPEQAERLAEWRMASLTGGTGLREHLAWQASVTDLDPVQAEILTHLIDALDEDGYLRDWEALRDELSARHGCDAVEAALARLQSFDPPGVGARDLRECLLLQLEQLPADPVRDLAARIVADQLWRIERGDEAALPGVLQADEGAVAEALALLRGLQPFPGRPFVDVSRFQVTPDVIVSRREGGWHVVLNPEVAPRIRINPAYRALIRRRDASPEQRTLREHLQQARALLQALHGRHQTLLAVAREIVEAQRAFLEHGAEAMRPLILRDIAERLGVHESTVSRATSGKYMLTPRGLYELKFFFSSSVATAEGGSCSATAIQAMIRRMVGEEPEGRPLSDAAICERLQRQGVRIARRTVAKYREAVGIPPAFERRRMARRMRPGGTAAAGSGAPAAPQGADTRRQDEEETP